jgi:hypothetical protein
MSKYTSEELQMMAEIVCEDHNQGGEKSMHLFIVMGVIMNMSPNEVYQKIQDLAEGITDD